MWHGCFWRNVMLVVCWLCSSWCSLTTMWKTNPNLTNIHCISYKLELVVPDAVKHHTLLTHFHIFKNSKVQKPSLDLGERPGRRLLPCPVVCRDECKRVSVHHRWAFHRKAQSRNLMFVVSADCFHSLTQSEYVMASLLIHLYDWQHAVLLHFDIMSSLGDVYKYCILFCFPTSTLA